MPVGAGGGGAPARASPPRVTNAVNLGNSTTSLETVRVLDPLPLHTAMSMSVLFPRDVIARHLERRLPALDAHLAELRDKRARAAAGIALLADLRAGRLAFAGEPAGWEPAPDDPGWQMHHDRERYKALLAGR